MSIKGFNISGTTYKVDYPELDNLPQINGNDLVGNMSGESLGLREVAFMTYLGATNARVETLLNSGVKIVLVKVSTDGIPDNETTCRLVKRINRNEHHFASASKDGRVYAILKDNRWRVTSEKYAKPSDIPRAATTLPQDLGIALIGTRVDYARADHAHAMPAAEDVGAIPDPTTKSSGQVLTYNGYSWVARTPSGGGGGMTEAVKQALLDCFEHVAWIDDQGQTYYNALYNALYPPKTVVSITAVFEQGSTVVYDSASLDSLKSMLTVTVRYDDNTTAILADSAYTLSGTLEAGTSTVTVTYNGKTDTFTVNVTAVPTLSSISAAYTQSGTVYDGDTLDSLKDDLVVTAHYSDSSTQTVPAADYTLSGTLTVGTSTITVSYGGKTTTFNVVVTEGEWGTDYTWLYKASDGALLSARTDLVTATNSNATETISDGNLNISISPDTTKSKYIRYDLVDTTSTNAKLSAKFRINSLAMRSRMAYGFRLQLSNGTNGIMFYEYWDGRNFKLLTYSGDTLTDVADLQFDTWYIAEVEKNNGTFAIKLNGETVYTSTTPATYYCTANRIQIQNSGSDVGETNTDVDISWIAFKDND